MEIVVGNRTSKLEPFIAIETGISPEEAAFQGGDKSEAQLEWRFRSICKFVVVACFIVFLIFALHRGHIISKFKAALIWSAELEDYGVAGWCALVALLMLVECFCLPGDLGDLCLGHIYGSALGVLGSVVAKVGCAVVCLCIGRRFKVVLGITMPESIESRLSLLQSHPLKTLIVARLAPVPPGPKNYAFALISPDMLPLGVYLIACTLSALPFSIMWCVAGSQAKSLVAALQE